jgi:thrombospondin type 3 repeat protein
MLLRGRVLGLVLTLGLAAPAGAKTLLILDSESGDYIGQGTLRQFLTADGTFTAQRNFDDGVSVSFDGSEFWTLAFAAPGPVELETLLYSDATRFGFQSAVVPGLDVSGDGRGCNELVGAFRVHEVVYGAGDVVDSFAADFVQHCEGSPRKLIGAIRFNASDALPDLFDDDGDGVGEIGDVCPGTADPEQRDADLDGAGDACDDELQASFVVFASDAGDSIGQGQRQHFNAANALIQVEENNDGGVTFTVETGDLWHLDFTAAGGGSPVVGVYEGATRWPFNGPTEPGLNVSGAGRGCNTLTGRFEVFEAQFAGDGTPLVFSADFEQHCEGLAPALRGSVRYRAAFRPVKKDLDGDGWLDKEDNCRGVANPPQYDTDADGRGDGCGLDPAEQRCVNEMNKGGAAMLKIQGAASLACLKNAAKGLVTKLGTPATAQDCLGNDVAGKLTAAALKLEAKEAAVCEDVAPAFGYSDAGEVADQASLAGTRLMAALFGPDLDAALILAATDPVGAKCQEEVVKRSQAALGALWKLTLKQKKAVLLGAKVLSATDAASLGDKLTGYVASDPGGAVTRAFAALDAGAGKRCGAVAGLAAAFPGAACAPADVPALGACAERAVRCEFCRSLDAFDDLALDCDLFDDGTDDASCD